LRSWLWWLSPNLKGCSMMMELMCVVGGWGKQIMALAGAQNQAVKIRHFNGSSISRAWSRHY
jgi:hypothetical protein